MSLLYIIGYMGAGKTCLGTYLARLWDLPLWDSDLILEQWHGHPAGEQLQVDPAAFRSREQRLVKQLIRLSQGIIVLGGGVVESSFSRKILQGLPVLLLDPGPEICWQRVSADGQLRPLARSKQEFFALYQQRLPLYRACCRWRLDGNYSVEILAGMLPEI